MSEKISYGRVYRDVAASISGDATIDYHWPRRWNIPLKLVEFEEGYRLPILCSESEQVQKIDDNIVSDHIVRWMSLQPEASVLLTYAQAVEAMRYWKASGEAIPAKEIAPIRWQDEPGWTWRRLPWTREMGPTPTWDLLHESMTNAAVFRQWLGSLFFEEARQHQYVWMHGPGQDGKGATNRFLKKVFGTSYRSKQPPAPGDKFWAHGLIGARLVVFPDCNSRTFTTSGFFKTLTGGDPIDVEAKGKMSFTTDLFCKFLFLSNNIPRVTGGKADMRRIIYCEFVDTAKKYDRIFESRLWAEGGAFLNRCIMEYEAACPEHEPFNPDKTQIEEWVEQHDEEFQSLFDRHFMQTVNEAYRWGNGFGELSLSQLDLVTLKGEELSAILAPLTSEKREEFRDWLYKRYQCRRKTVRYSDGTTKRYVGIHHQRTTIAAKRLSLALRAVPTMRVETDESPDMGVPPVDRDEDSFQKW